MKPTLTRKLIYIENSDKETIDFYNDYFHNDSYINYMQGIDERVDLICAGDGYRECQSNFDYFCMQAEMYIDEKQQDLTHTIITNQLELLEQQRSKVTTLPNLPGSYFTQRAVHNAFVSTVIDTAKFCIL
jgi:hypothetical protein